jgi:hypothetical protein
VEEAFVEPSQMTEPPWGPVLRRGPVRGGFQHAGGWSDRPAANMLWRGEEPSTNVLRYSMALREGGERREIGFLWRVLKATVSGFVANDALSRGASIAFYALRPWRPYSLSSLPRAPGCQPWNSALAGKAVLSALNTVVSLGIFTLLFAAIYRGAAGYDDPRASSCAGRFCHSRAVHRRKIADRMVPRSGRA